MPIIDVELHDRSERQPIMELNTSNTTHYWGMKQEQQAHSGTSPFELACIIRYDATLSHILEFNTIQETLQHDSLTQYLGAP